MAQEDYNIKSKTKDEKMRKYAIYIICGMVLILTVLLDIYFISEIFG